MTRTRALTVTLVALVAMLVAGGCGAKDKATKGAASRGLDTINAGTLTVGSDIPYAPFEFGRPPFQGFDVDIVDEIAQRVGLKAKFRKGHLNTILGDLARGRFDMVASAITITPAREKVADFSIPYFPADQSLMVKRGSSIEAVTDLKGKRVGAQLGTTGAAYANQETKANVRTYQNIDDAFNALEAGQVDAVINDFPVSKYTERSRKDLMVVQTIPTGEQYGLAFAKDKDALRTTVNTAIQAIKKDGTYKRIYRKWFQTDPPPAILNSES